MHEPWRTFASNTTLHGLRYVVGVSSWLRRLGWIVCMLAAIFFHIYLLHSNVLTYIDLPINTRISHEFLDEGIPFPAVTICNLNNWPKFKMDLGYKDKRFKKLGLDLPACDVVRNISGNLTCGQALICVMYENGPAVVDNCTLKMKSALENALKTSRLFNQEEFMYRYGHDFKSILLGKCQFSQNEVCSAQDFLPILTNQGGLCHTFNGDKKVNASRQRRVHYTGEGAGLRIVIDTQGEERAIGGMSVGFRVIIHNQSTFININRGFEVHPGTSVSALVYASKNIRLPAPYKTACSQRHLPFFGEYTRDACVFQCYNNASIKHCGCRIVGLPGPKEVSPCSIQDEICSHKLSEKSFIWNCSCSIPCEELRYDSALSYSKYPSKTLLRILKYTLKINKSEEYLRNNLVSLRIGFADKAYRVYRDVPSYGTGSLIADIGGNMGLLLGCSLLTLVEFLDYLCVAIFTILCCNKSRSNINTNNEVN